MRSGSPPVHIVVRDLCMDDVDGIEFIIRLRRRDPTMGVVVISGGGCRDKHEVLGLARRQGADRTLAKPFTREALLSAVSGLPARAPMQEQEP
jgi:DNA-binding response OmpR family regulator